MKPKFYRKVLNNGMTVIFEKREVPVVSVAFGIRYGSNNEEAGEKGIAHFIEHMLYKGTHSRSKKKIAEDIERNGGDLNGLTSDEVTMYFCKMPSKHLKLALDVLSDMVKNPLFGEEELEKERTVVLEEIKMYHDNPPRYIMTEIEKCLFEGSQGMFGAGTEKTVKSFNRDILCKKFDEIYKPNNMILCVVGDANFEEIVKFAEKNFGKEKGVIQDYKVINKNKIKIEKRKGLDQANLIFAYHSPTSEDKKNYAAQLLSVLMGSGFSSRLVEEIRDKRGLAYALSAHTDVGKKYGFSLVYVGTMKEKVEEVKKIILEEFNKVADNLTEEKLDQVREQMIGNYYISMEDSQSQMMSLINSEIYGDAKEFYDFEKNMRQVNLKEVKDIAKKATKDYSFFALVPE